MITSKKLIKSGFNEKTGDGWALYTIKLGYNNIVIELNSWSTGDKWFVREINNNRLTINLENINQVKNLIKVLK